MTKRILSLILVFTMILGTFSLVSAETGNPKIDKLVELGLVLGDNNGELNLSSQITRAEIATMITRITEGEELATQLKGLNTGFKDVSPTHWANGYINVAKGTGIITGYPNGTFGPDNWVTYEEAITMLVRSVKKFTPEELATAKWPTTFILAAAEHGILEGVALVDYKQPITRQVVFEMIYNTIQNSKDIIIGSEYEGIVVENTRTSGLNKDEFRMVLTKEVKEDDKVKYSEMYKIELKLNDAVKGKGWDTEKLLGKAVKVSFDKKGELVNIELLEGYKYVEGELDEISEKDITVDGVRYTVGRYDTSKVAVDNHLYEAYLNNESYEYFNEKAKTDFVHEIEENNINEFVRLTTKSGKILFVDALAFADIAPVAEGENDKGLIKYYDDNRSGDVNTLDAKNIEHVIVLNEGEFTRGDVKDITKNSVIHIVRDRYNKVTIVVNPEKEAKIEGEFKEVKANRSKDSADISIVIDDKSYNANVNSRSRNAVYSVNDEYYDLTGNYVYEIGGFTNNKVTILVDIFNEVQLISSDVGQGFGFGIISDVFNYEIKIVNGPKDNEWYRFNNSTKIVGSSGTKESQIREFVINDLVRFTAKDKDIVEIERLTGVSKVVEKVDRNVIEFEGEEFFYLDSKTIVYNTTGRIPTLVKLADFDRVFDTTKEIKGYVHANARSGRVAEVIVVTSATVKNDVETDPLIVMLDNISFDRNSTRINVVYKYDDYKSYVVLEGQALDLVNSNTLGNGSVLEIRVTKGDKKEVVYIEELIDEKDADTFLVKSIRRDTIELEDAAKEVKTLRITSDTGEFGRIREGEFVAIDNVNEYNTLKAIKVIPRATKATGYFSAVTPPDEDTPIVTSIVTTAGAEAIEVQFENGKIATYRLTGLARALVTKLHVGDTVKLVFEEGRLVDAEIINSPQANQAKANEVKTLITELDKTAPTFATKVKEARTAYNKLNDAQKALVTNYADLQAAELIVATTEVEGLFVDVDADPLVLATGIEAEDVEKAKTLVNALPESAEKTALLELITKAEALVQASNNDKNIADATTAVEALFVDASDDPLVLATGITLKNIKDAEALVDKIIDDVDPDTTKADLVELIEAAYALIVVRGLDEVNTAANAGAMKTALDANVEILELDAYEALNNLNRMDVAGYVFSSRPAGGYVDVEALIAIITEALE